MLLLCVVREDSSSEQSDCAIVFLNCFIVLFVLFVVIGICVICNLLTVRHFLRRKRKKSFK